MISLAIVSAAAVIAGPPANIYPFKVLDIDQKPVSLEKFKGQVLLVVNVASKCGNTPQYEGLQKLYTTHKSQGLAVLGFPANEFKGQEPGTNEDIKQFCTANYGVTFPMFSKLVVAGDRIHPLYQWLVDNADRHEPVEWNFAKFLIGRNGKVVARFTPKTLPNDPAIVQAIAAELAKK